MVALAAGNLVVFGKLTIPYTSISIHSCSGGKIFVWNFLCSGYTTSTTKVEFVKQLGADKHKDIEEKFDFLYNKIGDCKKSVIVAKDDAAIVDITWPPSAQGAVYSSLKCLGKAWKSLGHICKGEIYDNLLM